MSGMPGPTEQALDRVVQREDDFATVLAALYARRHTGMVILHFANGLPRKIELPGVQIALATLPVAPPPAPPDPPGGLDSSSPHPRT